MACGNRQRVAVALAAAVVSVAATPARADVSTYAYSLTRDGRAPAAGGIGERAVPKLRPSWHTRLSGAVNTEPLVARRVRGRDLVLVGTEHGRVAALDARSGRVVWQRRLGAVRDT